MGVDGGARERREELEEPGDELSGQLLGLDARIGHVDNPLIVLQILQQKKKINTHKKVLENPRNQKPRKKERRREGKESGKLGEGTCDLSVASLRRSTYL